MGFEGRPYGTGLLYQGMTLKSFLNAKYLDALASKYQTRPSSPLKVPDYSKTWPLMVAKVRQCIDKLE